MDGTMPCTRRLRVLNNQLTPALTASSDPNTGSDVPGAITALLGDERLVPVDANGLPDPAVLARLRAAMKQAAADGEYRLAASLDDLLAVVEPRESLLPVDENSSFIQPEEQTLDEQRAFFLEHGVRSAPPPSPPWTCHPLSTWTSPSG